MPATIENPETSRIWKLKSFQRARLTTRTTWTATDFCQDGTPWRKRTAFLATQLHHVASREVVDYNAPDGRDFKSPFIRKSLMEAAMRTCDGHGACTRSHRPHQLLRGIQPSSGRFFTIVAEPYPRKLCRRLVAAYAAAIAHFSEDHILGDLFSGMCDSQRNNKLYDPYDTTGPCRYGSRVCYCFRQCV